MPQGTGCMQRIWAISRRELYSYFSTPLAYILMAAFIFANSYLFSVLVFGGQSGVAQITFANISLILLLVTPLITMRLLSEESRAGTLELLLTYPVRDSEVVAGKFIGSFLFMLVMLGLTSIYFMVLLLFQNTSLGVVLTGYLGLILLSATFIAVGMFVSSLTQSQVVAALFSFVILLVMWYLGQAAAAVPGPVGVVLSQLGLSGHMTALAQGLLETKQILFFATVVGAFLFGAMVSLETRRWKG